MRTLLKYSLGTREATEAMRDGRMEAINKAVDVLTKPEAQYFCLEGGTRTGYVIFDLADPSDIPPIAETLFQVNAKVDFFPVMNEDDLGAGLGKAATAWA